MFFSRFLFFSAFLLSLSFLFLPLASPSFFSNIVDALAVAPALCAPASVARAMASDFHANLNVAAGVVSGTLTACGSMLLAVWGALPKRRGNAGSDSELPNHLNTFLEVRWVCVFASTLSHPPLALTVSLSLRSSSDSPSTRTHAHFQPSHLSHALSPSSPSPSSSSRLLLLFVLSSSSLYFLLPLLLHTRFFLVFLLLVVFFSFVSALANPCWLKPLWLPAQLLGWRERW